MRATRKQRFPCGHPLSPVLKILYFRKSGLMKQSGTLLMLFFYFFTLSLGQAQQTAGFICGFDGLRNPAQAQRFQSFEEQLQQYFSKKKESNVAKKGMFGPPYVVPVVVHIIHNGGPENISDARVLAAIDHMNEGFAAQGYFAQQGAVVNTQIQFCLARRDPDGNATTGITRTQSPLTNMTMETQDIQTKDLSRWNPKDYVNIWVVKEITSLSMGDGVAGYAYFPNAHGQPEDGMICEARFFGISHAEDAVLIHEMGHYSGAGGVPYTPNFVIGAWSGLLAAPRDRRNDVCGGGRCYQGSIFSNGLYNGGRPHELVEEFEQGNNDAGHDMLDNIDNYASYMWNRWQDRNYGVFKF